MVWPKTARKRVRLISIGWSQWQIKNGTLFSHMLLYGGQSVIPVGRFLGISEPVSSKPEVRKITDQRGQSLWEGGHQTESRQEGYNWTWMKLPTRWLLRISLAQVWFKLRGRGWGDWSLTGTSGPTSIQKVTRHKNTMISARCQIPHSHLRKQIHLEHNAQSHHGHITFNKHLLSVWGGYTGH